MKKAPCRGCSGFVKVPTSDFKKMAVAEKRASDLAVRLADSRARNRFLEQRNAELDLRIQAGGERVTLHRFFGEPWTIHYSELDDCLDKEHATFGQMVKAPDEAPVSIKVSR